MTNFIPPEPQNSPEEERLRQRMRARVRQETRDEWIAILVAFGTIGAILLWSLGLRKDSAFSSQWNQNFATSRIEKEEKSFERRSDQEIDSTANFAPVAVAPKAKKPRVDNNLGIANQPKKNNQNLRNSLIVGAPLLGGAKLGNNKPKVEPKPKIETKSPEPKVEKPPVKTPVKEPETKVSKPEVKPEPKVVDPKTVVSFDDVTEKHWAYPFLQELGKKKLVGATSDNNFEPDAPITRAGMATLISQAFNQPNSKKIKKFDDIKTGSDISKDIDKSVGIGFMKGYSDTEFRPSENIPRYQVMVALATGLGLKPSGDPINTLQGFSDRKKIPNWAISQVAAATESGLAVNRPSFGLDSLKPAQPATRAEVAAMIYQALKQQGKVQEVKSDYIIPKP